MSEQLWEPDRVVVGTHDLSKVGEENVRIIEKRYKHRSYYQVDKDDSDSERAVNPLRGVRPRHSFPAAPSQKEVPANKEANPIPISGRETLREAPASFVFQRDEYHSAIRGLGSSKTLLQGLSQPQFSSTPFVSYSSKSALVPEEEYLADEWLKDDLGELQPKKKRRLRVEQNGARGEDSVLSSTFFSSFVLQQGSLYEKERLSEASAGEMTVMPWMVRLIRREVNRSHSPRVTDDEDMRPETPPPPYIHMHMQPPTHTLAAPMPTSMPPPIRMRVRVQEDVFLIPVPQSEAASCTVSWLCEQAAQRYYQKCGLLPRLSLQKEGALLCPQDLLLAVLHTNEEVLAEVCSWDLPPLPERYSGGRAGEGCECFKGTCLEELDLSLNQLGDGVSESLSCCPLLARLSLQGCGLTARFLQQHRLLLANALSGTGHLKSVCLSHNALGSTGFELVLKTLPLHSLTHLDLSAVRRGPADSPADSPALEPLAIIRRGVFPDPPESGSKRMPAFMSNSEACRPLNLQGCEVCGPWDTAGLDGLSELVQDLRLCSQGLNKLDRQAPNQSWDCSPSSPGRFIDRNSRCLLSTPASS
ncbi:hypothetical protein JOQ06_028922 [Pogonophryne albipinna]|uniref:Uncharacterized protein n=1 Tax=Pogonophryne albipinna TaxID=1090488 RepID=A0AAD6BAY6_9TELE|nr:hypothetical protein JOQ06_028922 [Pogonophryne albipinna]